MLKQIEQAVTEAAAIIRQSGDKHIKIKSSAKDLVTVYDKMVQDKLYGSLSSAFPDAGFMGEEGLQLPAKKGGIFIIDPIDGTTNFIKGLNHSAVSVAYLENDEIKYGVIYDPFKNELFSAEKGRGTTLNGKPIHVSPEPMERSVALYGSAPYYEEFREKSFKLVAEINRMVIDTRRFGAATLDCCDVAAGRAEIYVEYYLCPWDYAAGSLIASEAGAIVTDMQGKPLQYKEKTSVVMCAPQCYKQIMNIIKEI